MCWRNTLENSGQAVSSVCFIACRRGYESQSFIVWCIFSKRCGQRVRSISSASTRHAETTHIGNIMMRQCIGSVSSPGGNSRFQVRVDASFSNTCTMVSQSGYRNNATHVPTGVKVRVRVRLRGLYTLASLGRAPHLVVGAGGKRQSSKYASVRWPRPGPISGCAVR